MTTVLKYSEQIAEVLETPGATIENYIDAFCQIRNSLEVCAKITDAVVRCFEEIATKVDELDTMKELVEELQGKVDCFESTDVPKLLSRNDKLESSNEELSIQVQRLESSYEELSMQVQRLEISYEELSTQIQRMSVKLEMMSAREDQLTKQMDVLMARDLEYKATLDDMKSFVKASKK